ncbi:hypothetical protein AQUCO_04000068v1 [Aquilegia coerulea]|uniref:Pentacotripeptide-repeat region of PRORP domain-containing protein n=1 Tax=Aquilegia coerulea TaxID=218851 RepID=A0A2G5CR46_AQUCA|nr:hypothetical protein AQUCO_04000068v1 [Aquilegia coerulea]
MRLKGIELQSWSKLLNLTTYHTLRNTSLFDLPKHHINQLILYNNFKTFSSLTNSSVRHRHPFEQLEYNSYYHLSNALQDCISAHDIRTGVSIHTQLIKLNPDGLISLWNKLLNLYCKCKHILHCRLLFDQMPQRDVVSFNTIITAYTRSDYGIREGLLLYVRMQEDGIKPNHITFSTLVGARGVASSQSMEVLHAQAIQYGLSSNEFVGSSLVDGYAKRMRLEDSIRAFNEIAELDLVSWNIMIDVCVRNGHDQHALRVFSSLRLKGVQFDGFTLSSVIKTCSEPRELGQGMQLHGCAIKAGLASETPISNALITMYSKCEKRMLSSMKVFEGILAPNIISWTAMVAGFMQNGLNEDAIGLYQKMLRYEVKENEFSFASILPAYGGLARLEQGMQVHARIVKSSLGLDISVGNALIDMYFKCGSLPDAKLAFKTMERRDVVSWTVMVTGLGQHGEGKEAIDILKAMISEGMRPDAVTFLGSLFACSHGGLVEEGLQVFRSMINVHNVKPRREHYACVVDMLGRAGRLEEAEQFIVDMGIESDVLVWEALLSACRTHGERELGERSAQKIKELDPKNDGPYVLLANIYADKGLWEDKGRVRESLGVCGLKKEAGSSWVALPHTH